MKDLFLKIKSLKIYPSNNTGLFVVINGEDQNEQYNMIGSLDTTNI